MNRRKRGFVYVASLLFITVLTILGTSLLVRSVSESSQSERFTNQSIALHVADAGVDQAAQNLRTPTDVTDDITTRTLPTGTFTLDAPVSLGANTWKAVSHGYSAKDTSRKRNIEAVYSLTPQSVFQFALFGGQSVAVSGNAITDSYDSRLGSYGSQTPSHHGDVGTNSTSVGGVNVGGSIFVDGQVVVGPNVSNPTSLVAGYDPAFITGGTSPPTDTQDVVSNSGTFPLPPVVVPEGMTCNDFTVQGNTNLVLPPGAYCYRNLTIEGNANMTATGQVTIYVTGELTAQGNSTVGVVNDPTQMLFQLGATAEATLQQTIQGNNTFYGAIYGPQATFNIQGNATIYGSVIARQVNVTGNAEIHYDDALTTLANISNLYQTSVVYWQELDGS